MKFTPFVFAFLMVNLAVASAFAQYAWHMGNPINLNDRVTYHFGDDIYIYSDYDIRITKFFEAENGTHTWFNYTVNDHNSYGWSVQSVYNANLNATYVFINDVLSTSWTLVLGRVRIWEYSTETFPAEVSIAYAPFVPPEAVYINILIDGWLHNTSEVMNGMPITVTDGTDTMTAYTGTPFSIINNTAYNFTAQDTDYTFYHWSFGAQDSRAERTFSATFLADQTLAVYYNSPAEYWFFPIVPIVGLVGLGLMFAGPSWAIYQVKEHHEYQKGLVWGTVLTALGFAFFMTWVYGGIF